MRQRNQLPTVQTVELALAEAWGFNFYLPRQLLIMRFSPESAEGYVDETERHETFHPVAYKNLFDLVEQEVEDPRARAAVKKILDRRSPSDIGVAEFRYESAIAKELAPPRT